MPNVLITGVQGFTGRYLAERLRREGYQVSGISHRHHAPEDGVCRCDLLDRDAIAEVIDTVRPDCVVHFAAIAFVAHGDVDAMYRTNVVGTRNLLGALAESAHDLRSIMVASSANIYGNTAFDPLTEAVPPAPANDYGVSKAAMEYMARLWSDRLPITFVRPFNYTGVGQSPRFVLPKLVDHFRRRAPEIELGALNVARDFSDVRMVVDAYAKLLAMPGTGEVYNVCSGTAHSLGEAIEMLERLAGYRIEVRVNPAFVRHGEVRYLRGSNEKLETAIGPLEHIALGDTLRWMYEA
ncbi:NAD-dependent epimerase/dehydratase family protein [Paraburkholderia tropica]|uniref:NAD-dependent epimerase/dehydratase family protein n=1 Tax=Paraburkholderia tropica TaxID=92647 RepID=UPI002AB613D5|nr:NAD-dependent epimerase/dehydratase family protein [Paraburkholderia tropica]